MINKKAYFDELEKLHLELDTFLGYSFKECSDCINCCINLSEGFIFIPLYVDYINYNLARVKNNIYSPITWEEGLEINLCPYINLEEKRCGIYDVRPLVCRLYPRLIEKSESSLYHKCVFYDTYEFSDLDSTTPYIEKIEGITREISELNTSYLKDHSKDRLKVYKEAFQNRMPPEKKLKRDIEAYKGSLDIEPNSSPIHYYLAKTYIDLGEKELGIREIDHTLRLDEAEYRARMLRIKIYQRENRLEDAIEEIKKAITINANNSQAYYILGIMYLMAEKYDEAHQQFCKLVKINPIARDRYKDTQRFIELCEQNMRNNG